MAASLSAVPVMREMFRGAADSGRLAALAGQAAAHRFLADPDNEKVVLTALRIRAVETALYDLFGRGRLHGTIHTCLGQEFSGAVLGRHLRQEDYVTSNHRCHGHFIGATGDWRGLMDELVGNEDGVCAGIGSSQHLWARNFISNGQQGGLLPVAAGVALDRKTRGQGGVAVSFMGEGTLGEGIVYETLNLDALWQLPHVMVCENNFYSQSTPQTSSVAGSIAERAAAFGIAAELADSWDLPAFDAILAAALERARARQQPSFIVLSTYRLNPHSKGDDQRDKLEIAWFRAHDPLTLALRDHAHFRSAFDDFAREAAAYGEAALAKPALPAAQYFGDQLPAAGKACWQALPAADDAAPRVAQDLNTYYTARLEADRDAFFLGEDIADPYGGAFKIARGMTDAFGARVLTTPISEAAITGVGIGLAITGRRAFVEIMFGDFITYAFDQLVNNASKIFHMYNRNLDCPVVVRAPMGGRRGYGPTHSQSLERFLIGLDNCCTVSLHSLAPVAMQLAGLARLRCPVILLENKSDYAARCFAPPDGIAVESNGAALPTVRVRPLQAAAGVTLVAYGGMARFVAQALIEIFERTDCVPELIVPGCLCPIDVAPIAASVSVTGRILVIEEGPGFGSAGAEILSRLLEQGGAPFRAARLSGQPVPIPSCPALEDQALPGVDEICAAVLSLQGARP